MYTRQLVGSTVAAASAADHGKHMLAYLWDAVHLTCRMEYNDVEYIHGLCHEFKLEFSMNFSQTT